MFLYFYGNVASHLLLHKEGIIMAEATEKSEVKEAKAKKSEEVLIRAVHGYMVNMSNPAQKFYTESYTSVPEIDGWVQLQLDAGKLVVKQ